MLKERNKTGADTHDLLWRNVDKFNIFRRNRGEITVASGDNIFTAESAFAIKAVAWREHLAKFLVGAKLADLSSCLAILHFSIWREQETVSVDFAVNTQAGDQTNVGAFRRFNWANTAVMGNMHVAYFECGALSVETSRPKGRETSFMHKHGKRIGLIHHLAEFAATKEEFNGA